MKPTLEDVEKWLVWYQGMIRSEVVSSEEKIECRLYEKKTKETAAAILAELDAAMVKRLNGSVCDAMILDDIDALRERLRGMCG